MGSRVTAGSGVSLLPPNGLIPTSHMWRSYNADNRLRAAGEPRAGSQLWKTDARGNVRRHLLSKQTAFPTVWARLGRAGKCRMSREKSGRVHLLGKARGLNTLHPVSAGPQDKPGNTSAGGLSGDPRNRAGVPACRRGSGLLPNTPQARRPPCPASTVLRGETLNHSVQGTPVQGAEGVGGKARAQWRRGGSRERFRQRATHQGCFTKYGAFRQRSTQSPSLSPPF